MKFKNNTGGPLYLAAIRKSIKTDGIFEADPDAPTIHHAMTRGWIVRYEEGESKVTENTAEKIAPISEEKSEEKAPRIEEIKEQDKPEEEKAEKTEEKPESKGTSSERSIPAKAVVTPSGSKNRKKHKAGGEKK